MLHTRTVRCAGIITLLVASALVGCGDDSTSETGGTEGTGAGGGGTGGDATGTGGGGTGGDPGTGGAGTEDPIGSGYISVYSGSYNLGGNPSASYSATAAFTPPTAPTSRCTQQAAGGCWVYSCPVEGAPPPAGAPDAGVITLVAGAKTVTLTPDATGVYVPASADDEALWAAGQTLSASAPGAEVPSFDINVAAPTTVNVSAPVFPASPGQLVISKANALDVAWSGGGAGFVSLYAGRTEGDTKVLVSCAFLATAGQGAIPAEALALVPSGPDGYLQVVSSNSTNVSRPEWTITLNAGSIGATASGSASGLATFE